MFKFIHIADVHFDNIFATKRKHFREILRKALYDAFEKAIDLCIEKEVHGLLIAGDLFESSIMSFKTERFIMKEFKRLEKHGIQVFYTIGNHDVGVNHQTRKLEWPENVHIFDSDQVMTLEVFDNKTGNVCKISGCGHISVNESRNLIPLFPAREEGSFHIGLVHTMVTNASIIDNDCYYLPCKSEDLESKDYHYWALGHIHKRQQIGQTSIYYAGNPQGLKSKETDEKGVLYVEIDEQGHTETKFLETSMLVWKNVNVNISICKSNDELLRLIHEALQESGINSQMSHRYIPKINLIGRSVLKQTLTQGDYMEHLREELLDQLLSPELILKCDDLKADYDRELIEKGNHVVSEVLSIIKDVENEQTIIDQLINISFAKVSLTTEDEKKAYVMSLMNNMDEELIEHFLEVRNEN